jgi:cation transport ATPase
MNSLMPLNGALFALTSLATVTIIVSWWWTTRGAWLRWPAGRSLMGLLAIIAVITANATAAYLLGANYPAKPIMYSVLYAVLLVAVIGIGVTIHCVQRSNDRRRAAAAEEEKEKEHHG